MTAREIANLLEHPAAAGPVVLLAVGAEAQKSGDAARHAIALADAFAARGESVVLADLSLQEPELHKLLAVSNDEGLSDVFLFGASLPHVTLATGHEFKLIPASQFTPDSREILEHAWWGHVFEELAQQKTKLLCYLPMQLDGAESFSDRVGTTIIIGDSEEISPRLGEDAEVLNAAPSPEPEPTPPPAPTPPPEPSRERDDEAFEKIRIPKDSSRDALIADIRRRQREALMAPPPAMHPLPYEGGPPISSRTAPPPDVRPIFMMPSVEEEAPRSRAALYWILTAFILIAAGAAFAIYWNGRKAPPPPLVTKTPQTTQASGPPQPAQPVATGTALPWSVAIASYQTLSQAQERLDQLHAVENGIDFYVGPVVVDGTMNYKVLAGPVSDSASAKSLRDTLIARRIKTGSTGWDVVTTPYAFLLGDFANRNDAEATMHAAENKGIPSYIIEAVAQDGSTQYKLYAGAYTGPGEAEFLRARLKQAGFPDNLVERTGSTRS